MIESGDEGDDGGILIPRGTERQLPAHRLGGRVVLPMALRKILTFKFSTHVQAFLWPLVVFYMYLRCIRLYSMIYRHVESAI